MSSSSASLLQRLRGVLDDLRQDRVTVRKKALDILPDLLDNDNLVLALSARDAPVSWTTVYDSCWRCLERNLAKANRVTEAGKTSGINSGASVSAPLSLIKKVIRKTIGNGSNSSLPTETVVMNMLAILELGRDALARNLLAVDAVRILHQLVAVPDIARSLKQLWRPILEATLKMFTNPTKNADLIGLCNFFSDTLILSDVHSSSCFSFTTSKEVFSVITELLCDLGRKSSDQSLAVINLAQALFKLTARDCRRSILRVGESATSAVLASFGNAGVGSERLREATIVFFQTQMIMHHPRGARTEEEGAAFCDEAAWRLCLHRIYSNLVDNVICNVARKSKLATGASVGSGESLFVLPNSVLRLAVDICYQLISATEVSGASRSGVMNDVEVTQYVPRDQTQEGTAAKRRRLTAHWTMETILEKLDQIYRNESSSSRPSQLASVTPWLQILTDLLRRHGYTLVKNPHVATMMLLRLLKPLQECKSGSVRRRLLQALEALWLVTPKESRVAREKDWRVVLSCALHVIVSNASCLTEGHRLLRTLLPSFTQVVSSQLYAHYLNSSVRRSSHSVKTLCCLISVSPTVPEPMNLTGFTDFRIDESLSSKVSGRISLLSWLYNVEEEDRETGEENGFDGAGALDETEWRQLLSNEPRAVAALLWCLLLREVSVDFLQTDTQNAEDKEEDEMSKLLKEQGLVILPEFAIMTVPSDGKRRTCTKVPHHITLVDEVVGPVKDCLFHLAAKSMTELSRGHLPPAETFNNLEAASTLMTVLAAFLSQRERIGVGKETFSRLDDVFGNLGIQIMKVFTKLLDQRPLLMDTLKATDKFKTLLEDSEWANLFHSVIFQLKTKMEAVRDFTQKLSKLTENLASEAAKDEDASGGSHIKKERSGVSKSVMSFGDSDEEGDVNQQTSDDIFGNDSLPAKKSNQKERSDAMRKILDLLRVLLFPNREVFPCISADVWPSLSQCQISSAQSATDLITQDQPRTCFEDSTKHVLAFFMGILARGASPELLHCVCEALVTVPTKAPGFGGKKKKETLGFDPELTQALLETLEAYAEQVANYEICDEDDDDPGKVPLPDVSTLLVHMKSFVYLHAMSSFQLLSRRLQCHLVGLIAKVAKLVEQKDVLREVVTWKAKDHYKCGYSGADRFNRVRTDSGVGADLLVPLRHSIFRFLVHESQDVRSAAVTAAQTAFCGAMKSHRAKEDFKELHCQLAVMCEQSRSGDELSNRVSTLLNCLAALAVNYPVLTRESVAGLLLFHRQLSIPIQTLRRLVRNVAVLRSGSADLSKDANTSDAQTLSFLSSMLSYVLRLFLKEKDNRLEDFPLGLLGCNDLKEFFERFENVIVPVSLWQSPDNSTLMYVSSALKLGSIRDVCKRNFAHIVSYYLPHSVAEIQGQRAILKSAYDSNDQLNKAGDKARKLERLISQTLGMEEFQAILTDRVAEVIAQVFKRIHDPAVLAQRFGPIRDDFLLPPNPPYSTESLALNLIKYFSETAKEHLPTVTLLAYLTSFQPDCIQRLCQELSSCLWASQVSSDRLGALQGLAALITIIREEKAQLKTHLPFTVWYLGTTLLSVMKQSESEVGMVACALLTEVIDLGFECASTVTNGMIARLTNGAIQLVQTHLDLDESNGQFRKECLKLLALIIERGELETLRKLRSFPANLVFAALRQKFTGLALKSRSLSEVMQNFLDHTALPNEDHSETLNDLLEALTLKRKELSVLLADLNDSSNGLEEDAEKSLIHKSLCRLFSMATGLDCTSSNVAAQCLGQIGPCNLSTLVLMPQKFIQTKGTPFTYYVGPLISSLMDLVGSVGSDLEASSAASEAVKYLLDTSQGAKLTKDQLGDIKVELIAPFMPLRASLSKNSAIGLDTDFVKNIADEVVWCGDGESTTHEDWLKRLTTGILSCLHKASTFRLALMKICELRADFCEFFLPILVHDLLYHMGDKVGEVLASGVGSYFRRHYENVAKEKKRHASNQSDTSVKPPFLNKRSLTTMLNLVAHLRRQKRPKISQKTPTVWDQNFWLPCLNYLHVAQAALTCGADLSAVQFADIWCQTVRITRNSTGNAWLDDQVSAHASQPLLDLLAATPEEINPEISRMALSCQEILFAAYSRLNEGDALYGCGVRTLMGHPGRLELLLRGNEERYRAMAMAAVDGHSIQDGERGRRDDGGGVLREKDMPDVLYQSGLHGTLRQLLRSSSGSSDSPRLQAYRQECAWRLAQWHDLDGEAVNVNQNYEGLHSWALKHLIVDGNVVKALAYADSARTTVCKDIGGLESARSVYRSLGRLRTLREIDIWSKSIGNDPDALPKDSLAEYDKLPTAGFSYLEECLLQRCVLAENLATLKQTRTGREKLELTALYKNFCLRYVEGCACEGRLKSASDALSRLEKTSSKLVKVGEEGWLKLRRARLSWQSGDKERAVMVLSDLQNDRLWIAAENSRLRSEVLCTLGAWSAELRIRNPDEILEQFFLPAVKGYEEASTSLNGETIAPFVEAHLSVARFCEERYRQLADYMRSKEFEEKQSLRQKLQTDVKHLNNAVSKEVLTARTIMLKHSQLEGLEIESLRKDRRRFLELALRHYATALAKDDGQETVVCRLISLWFSNCDDPSVSADILGPLLATVPSWKFLGLLYQMAARLGSGCKEFADALSSVLFKCAHEHPFHTLHVLLALVNADKDEEEINRVNGQLKKQPKRPLDARGSAAQHLLIMLEKKSEKCARIIPGTQATLLALIRLAYTPVEKSIKGAVKLKTSEPIRKVKDVEHIPVLTAPLPHPQRRGGDQGFVGIHSYEESFSLVGGVNAPKRIKCRGTDGKWYTQLVKGKDDLRQDAVMQQVFGLMNTLLKKDVECSSKRLCVRQYRVVPLSQRSGVLEWCHNTVPVGDYLIEAHRRYRPADPTPVECKKNLQVSHLKHKEMSNREQLNTKAFISLCSRIHPVLRFFFVDHFSSPGAYLERRFAYTRSVAAASMTGHILGLGDRHVSNILMDLTTAEMIHIDLGVAFEQGRILPTPEKVPFRLSRDVVDGFGPSGVEGIFRRSCESTMRVLRAAKDELMTILAVLMYDPLYNWSMTPEKANRIQAGSNDSRDRNAAVSANPSGSSDDKNKMAERVLRRVSQKLDGHEEGHLLSVEGQVNVLIQQARDPVRLGNLYVGWQAYL